jgi:hypothetical protein
MKYTRSRRFAPSSLRPPLLIRAGGDTGIPFRVNPLAQVRWGGLPDGCRAERDCLCRKRR